MQSVVFLLNPIIDYIFKITGYPKWRYHFFFPLILLLLIICLYCYTKYGNQIFYNFQHCLQALRGSAVITIKDVSDKFITLLTFMSAFSFVALVGLPATTSVYLDQQMTGNPFGKNVVHPIQLLKKHRGQVTPIELTRKQFLSKLVGYICCISTVLLILNIFVIQTLELNIYLEMAVFGILTWGLLSLFLNMLYAIQYFTNAPLTKI